MNRLTTSNIKLFKNCRKKYYFRMIEGLVPKKKSGALLIGEAGHLALETLYKDFSLKRREYIQKVEKGSEIEAKKALRPVLHPILKQIETFFYNSDEIYTEDWRHYAIFLVKAILRGYYEKYFPDEYDRFEEFYPEVEFSAPIYDAKGERVSDCFCGKVDGILKENGKYWLMENKITGAKDLYRYKERLWMDYQNTGYLYGIAEEMGLPLEGVIYNIIRKPHLRAKKSETANQYRERIKDDYLKRPNFYFVRKMIYRNDYELGEFRKELFQVYKDIRGCNEWYRNSDACSQYAGCEYKSICRGGYFDKEALSQFKKRKKNPELSGSSESSRSSAETGQKRR